MTRRKKEVEQKDFVARDYFINHPDADINALAMQLTTASEKLTKAEIEHEKGLQETVVHILLEYKYRFFKNEFEENRRGNDKTDASEGL